jgi:hypothetical protein
MHSNSYLYIETVNLDYIINSQNITLLSHEYFRYYSSQAIQQLMEKYYLYLHQMTPLFNQNYQGSVFRLRPNIKSIGDTLIKFEELISKYKKIVIWGVSGRAISFLSHMNWGVEKVKFGVDIDQSKQGKFIPITGQVIISPTEAINFKPELVIISNSNYLNEIKKLIGYDLDYVTLDGNFYLH